MLIKNNKNKFDTLYETTYFHRNQIANNNSK